MDAAFPSITAPRLVVSGLSGGGGKTLLSLGLARALTLRGLRVKPCKKGPDYIDAAWLGLASGRTPTNLDPFFLTDARFRALFFTSFGDADLAIIEGNRGLYDGRDVQGSCSTATLARALGAPVLLTLTVTKMTRTAAAVIAWLAHFEPVNLAGVVLNRVASSRHAALIRQSIETYTGIPVLGEIPRLAENPIPERHMGLVSMHDETPDALGRASLLAALDSLAGLIERHMDIDAALRLARSAPDLRDVEPFWEGGEDAAFREAGTLREGSGNAPQSADATAEDTDLGKTFIAPGDTTQPHNERVSAESASSGMEPSRPPEPASTRKPSASALIHSGLPPVTPVTIGFVRDAALWFYYEENFEALRRAGAELVELSLLSPEPWPGDRLDGLYLGGGFPEMVPERLADSPHLAEIREYSMRGMPIYAECGGFMVLCQELQINGKQYPMTGIFPARAEFCPRPQGLGYVEATVEAENPFHPVGALLRGHEFHYSRCVALGELEPTLRLSPGVGMSGPGHRAKGLAAEGPDNLKSRDGLLVRNTFAAYTHLFAPAVPHWAARFAAACRKNA